MQEPPEPFRPRPWRVLLAFLVAPYAASLLPFIASAVVSSSLKPMPLIALYPDHMFSEALFIALIGAYPIAFFLGGPLFALLYGRVGFGPIPPILCGYFIVAVGVTALQAIDHPVGWDGYLLSAETALLGAFGGLVFWVVAIWRDPRRRRR